MINKFKIGDRVRFKKLDKYWYNKTFRLKGCDYGTIVDIGNNGYEVKFDNIEKRVYMFEEELEPVDEVYELIKMTKEVMKK